MSQEKKAGPVKKSFAVICKPENLSRCDYFSDTYTTVMTVNGQKKVMDVTHISLPFRPNREKAVMKYFDIDKQGMYTLYAALAKCISNQVNTCTYLNNNGVQSVMRVVKSEITPKGSGRKGNDIYLLTEHLRSVSSVYFNKETTHRDIINFGLRLSKLVKDIHQVGDSSVTMRVIDPEQIFVDNEGRFVFGSFHYAYNTSSAKPPIPMAETAPLHIAGKVSTGAIGDIGTDMYSIASIMWSLLNGDGFDKPTPTGTPPKYATEEMTAVLELGLGGDPEMFNQFRRKLGNIYKAMSKKASDEDGSEDVVMIPVPAAQPCISAPLVEMDFGVEEDADIAAAPVQEATKPIQTVPSEEPDETAPPARTAPILPHGVIYHGKEVQADEGGAVLETVHSADSVDEEKEACASAAAEAPAVSPIPFDNKAGEEDANNPSQELEQDEDIAIQHVKRLDTTDYVQKTESECDVVPDDPTAGLNFEIVYNKPKFFIKDLLVAAGIAAVFAALVYASVKMHLISFW